jgi:predicted HAD superfamily Cof-like phosphohydrolase
MPRRLITNGPHSIHRVREFHETFGHPVASAPTAATLGVRELRVKLIAEELMELCVALGVELRIEETRGYSHVSVMAYKYDTDVNLVEAADALGDLDYVVQGSNLVFGFPAETIADEIHRSNMSKAGPDGKPIRREDGKILKGPNYTPPDIEACLKAAEPAERAL